jgi:fructose-specific component phosphotransferase system IIB-like protein
MSFTPLADSFSGTNTTANGTGTCAATATDYTLAKAAPRQYLSITNTHASAKLTVNLGAAAYAGGAAVGRQIAPGATLEFLVPPLCAVHVAADTAGATYFVVDGQ